MATWQHVVNEGDDYTGGFRMMQLKKLIALMLDTVQPPSISQPESSGARSGFSENGRSSFRLGESQKLVVTRESHKNVSKGQKEVSLGPLMSKP